MDADCGPNRPTSVLDFTNALVAEWKQDSAAIFQHLAESLPRKVEAVIAAKGCIYIYHRGVYIQCLAKVFGPLELCDLLPHFRLQT